MAMGGPSMAGAALAAVNAGLLAVLTAVWVRNYRRFNTRLLLGLVAFGVVLLVENLVGVYFFVASMQSLYANDPGVGRIVLGMRALELLAVALLTAVTLR